MILLLDDNTYTGCYIAVLQLVLCVGVCSCLRITCSYALWHGHSAPPVTQHLQLLDPDYGTVFHRTRKRRTNLSVA